MDRSRTGRHSPRRWVRRIDPDPHSRRRLAQHGDTTADTRRVGHGGVPCGDSGSVDADEDGYGDCPIDDFGFWRFYRLD